MITRNSRRRLASALALALGAGLATPGASAGERALTLAEATALALEKNDAIVVERESLASASAAVSGAEGAYDPLLELDGGWRRATVPVNSAFSGAPLGEASPTGESVEAGVTVRQLLPTGGTVAVRAAAARTTSDSLFALLSPAYDSRVGVELRQPLLRDRAVDAARSTLRVTAADQSRAAAGLRRETTETVAAVERAYWTLVEERRAVTVREEAVRLAEEQLAETGIRVGQGAVPQTEIAQPRAELERRRGELLAAQESVSRAESALKLLILGEDDEAIWLERLVPVEDTAVGVVTVDVAASLERALASRPEVEEAAALVERRQAESDFAADGIRPALDVVLAYDRFGLAGSGTPGTSTIPGLPGGIPPGLDGSLGQSFETLGDGDFDDARIGLVFSIPLGNRAAKAGAAQAHSTARQADAILAQTRKAVRAEVLDAAAALDTAGQRIEAGRSAREAAEVQLAAERERYGVGLSTNFLVLTRQNDLARARLDEISAQTDYLTARTEMARATGTLLAERRIDVSE